MNQESEVKSSNPNLTCSIISSLPKLSSQTESAYGSSNIYPTNHSVDSNVENKKKEMITACPLCLKEVTGSLDDHFQLEHREYECAFCGLLFDSNSILNTHMLTAHPTEYNIQDSQSPGDTLTCPICNLTVKEGIEALETHVDSHLINDEKQSSSNFKMVSKNEFSKSQMASASRTSSDSSLVANVDENFEMDQVITLGDNDDEIDFTGKSDYELALLLDAQEKKRNSLISAAASGANPDYLSAQLLERHQKYQESEQSDLEYAIKLSQQQVQVNEVDMEHEWLKQKYGMTNTKASARAEMTLNKAFKSNKIDIVTYHNEKSNLENCVKSPYDDASTRTQDLIQLIQTLPLNRNLTARLLCSQCDHYASGFLDNGYGCGYRNTQMLFSSIREDANLKQIVFNNDNTRIPSINKIQSLIEHAWKGGFDLDGQTQLGGVLVGTSKWIGGSDVCAMFSSLRIKCELVDIQPPKGVAVAPILFRFVRKYFEEQQAIGQHIHPIYLQHDGHSRTIVGIELGSSENLLLFDPSNRKSRMDQFKENALKNVASVRKSFASFNKFQVYQLLVIRGALETEAEYQRVKVLTSTRLTS